MKKQHLHKLLPFLLAALLAGIMPWYHRVYIDWIPSLYAIAFVALTIVMASLTLSVFRLRGEHKLGTLAWKTLLSTVIFSVVILFGVSFLINNVIGNEGMSRQAAAVALPLGAAQVVIMLWKPWRALERKARLAAGVAVPLLVAASASVIFFWTVMPDFTYIFFGNRVDLSKFEMTWSDEFDGEALDPTKWRGHFWGVPDNEGQSLAHKRRDGWWAMGMARVEDGMLHIPSVYLEEGAADGPAGYYSLGIETRGLFEQKYGYFEARVMLPKGQGLWSAFWMMPNAFGADPEDGQTGAEVDIYESAYYKDRWPKKNSVSSAIHYGGYGENLRSQGLGSRYVSKPYDTFHTYGIEWNENEYVFYIDGREIARSFFGGVCRNELYLLLSVEHEFGGWAGDIRKNKPGEMTDFVVDYVRVYQYKKLL